MKAEARRVAVAMAIAALAVSSCRPFDMFWIEIWTGHGLMETEWPRDSGEYVTMNNLLTDSAGLAGLEIELFTPDSRNITLTAASFSSRTGTERISVGESGTVRLFARLRQNGVVVAEGHTSWTLRSDVEEWRVLVQRAPMAPGMNLDDLDSPNPRCRVPWCHKIRRIVIWEDARNYRAEALWLEVDRARGWEG